MWPVICRVARERGKCSGMSYMCAVKCREDAEIAEDRAKKEAEQARGEAHLAMMLLGFRV